ncbi:MAG: hypothetical protein P1U87_19680 [Verrucomicrobiales bacterium]|nr:hypothetical protein [Verrucomicrobiales bacterium]
MILDAIIGLFVSLFGFLAEGLAMAFVPLLNLIAACLEAVIGIFVSGFSLGRIERKKGAAKSRASAIGGVLVILLVVGLISWLVLFPKVMNRKLTLVAEDGCSLPFAALIIHTEVGDLHERTDNAGNIVVPRFATNAITVKDPRYVEKRWSKSKIESELAVGRTVLGSGLDSLADKLLNP